MWRIIWEAAEDGIILDWHEELVHLVNEATKAGIENMQTIEIKDLADGFSVRTTSFNDEELVIERFNLSGISPDLLDSFIRDNRPEGDICRVDLETDIYVKVTENDSGELVHESVSGGFRFTNSSHFCATYACGIAFRDAWTPGSVKVEYRLGKYGDYATVEST